MLTFATQTFADGTWTLMPEEPAALTLALVGLGTLAIYAIFSGWRPRRSSTFAAANESGDSIQTTAAGDSTTRQAA